MRDKPIFVSEADIFRLRALLASKGDLSVGDKSNLRDLRQELDRATVLPGGELPSHVIAMNTRFRLKDLDTGHVDDYELVYPGSANIHKGRISVTAPIGTALLGYSELDTIEWHVPAGVKRFRVEKIISQPRVLKESAA